MVEQVSGQEPPGGLEVEQAGPRGTEDAAAVPPFAREAPDVLAAFGTDPTSGLSSEEAARRLASHGPNRVTTEKPPSVWEVAGGQLRDPMNIMLLGVIVAGLVIGEVSTAVIVALLVVLNIVLGSTQELKARASVNALANLQVPQAKVVRDGTVELVAAADVVPGDLVQVEAGDVVPADGRIVRSATLETQEAALTGESAPVPKAASVLPSADVPLGDRSNMLFQNTAVTRGTAAMVVTATGMDTQMGQIATMLTSVSRTRSPLQKELASLTKVLGVVAWSAVALIVVVGLARGLDADQVLLLGISMAISAIPTGLPAFVSGLLSAGAKQLAAAKAIVKNLTDVETLGSTSAINTDKTGTLTMNEMMVSVIFANGAWFPVDGEGYRKTGAIRSAAGITVPDFTNLALGLALDSDATVSDDGAVVGDPTEAALVVLSAKLGVDAEETRRAYPRLAEVPFDSDYKFMATFHRATLGGRERVIELVKGAPDVVLARCARSGGPLSDAQVPIDEARAQIEAANERMGEQGLRVLAFAGRFVDDSELEAMATDPMSLTRDLGFVAMVGIIDPLRVEAKGAVHTALDAGIDVRMITGDHAVTAQAIGKELGLGPGAISGPELAGLSDDELAARLPELHVFGRVSPEDKLRLARLMQQQGLIVAMTGDAVNDAAALKQADIGVAMGSGSEVTKQAARMILTDDNFGTLVNAVEIGRRTYDKVVAYVRYQMTQLLGLVMLFVAATVFDVNEGVALTPSMILYLLFFVTVAGVVIIAIDPGDPDVMHRAPRDRKVPITNRRAVTSWLVYGAVLFIAAFIPLVAGPDKPSTHHGSASMTMTFAVMGLGTVFNALTNRRDPTSGLTRPILSALGVALVPVILIFLATQLPTLQKGLLTVPLSGPQWLASVCLALLLPVVVESSKWWRRHHAAPAAILDPRQAVAPARAASPAVRAGAASRTEAA
jgi:Ca2+-transporting ATPase